MPATQTERVQIAPRLVELLLQYHGGGGSGCYSVGSRLFAGHEVLRSDEQVARAIDELRKHRVWASNEAPVEAEDETDTRAFHMRDCEELISWLQEDQDLLAHRRIGEVDIYIECKEPDGKRAHAYVYKCRLECTARGHEKVVWNTEISEPMVSDVGVDSDEAYDRVARACMSFATSGIFGEGDEDNDYPDETEQQAINEAGGWCYDAQGIQYVVHRP